MGNEISRKTKQIFRFYILAATEWRLLEILKIQDGCRPPCWILEFAVCSLGYQILKKKKFTLVNESYWQ